MRVPTSGAFYLTLGVLVFGAGAAALHLRGPAEMPVDNGVVSRAPDAQLAADPALAAAAGGGFALAWLAVPRTGAAKDAAEGRGLDEGGEQVYLARIDASGVAGAPTALAAPGRTYARPFALALPDGRVAVVYAFDGPQGSGVEIATLAPGQPPAHAVLSARGKAGAPSLCAAADGAAMAVFRDEARGIVAAPRALDASRPAETVVSLPAERLTRERPGCWLGGHEAWVTYATGDTTLPPKETTSLVDTLVLTHSTDDGRNFRKRAGFRPGPRMMLPAVLRDEAGFTLVAVTGSGRNDARAEVSAMRLATDGSSQKGLTQAVLSPVEMVVSDAQPGFMGDYVGLARAGKTTLAALVDNHEGPPRVTVVPVPE